MLMLFIFFDFYGVKDLEYIIILISFLDMKESGVKGRNMVSLWVNS